MSAERRSAPARASGRRVAATGPARPSRLSLVVAVLVPLVTLGAIALTDGSPAPTRAGVPPTDSALTSLQVVCPAPLDEGDLLLSSARSSGQATLRLGADQSSVDLAQDATTVITGRTRAATLDGRGDLAPGLVATSTSGEGDAATVCAPPQSEYWFTGGGSASIHSSVLELVNSDSGPAVADVEIRSQRGRLSVNALRGVTVPGGTATSIDLASTAPNRFDLSVHVTITRGRLGASLLDRISDTTDVADWLSATPAPSTSHVLLGLTEGRGERQLVISNPGEDQARLQVKVIGSDSTFAPVGLGEISVPPQGTLVTDVSDVVRTAMAKEVSGLLITSTVPVTAGMRSLTGSPKDLSHAVDAIAMQESATLIPVGQKKSTATLVLAAPEESGAAMVTAYDADGAELDSQRVAVKRLTSGAFELPDKTALVSVVADDVPLPGAITVTGPQGSFVLPLTDLVLTALVPSVTPGNPSVLSGSVSSQSSP
ncbi:DUF5719 family protein [Nocardioides sp.]|uniref:DUF5719 family protein n=1 Tax=Nocardioides sp. TaxID=35761 RepID=UPI003D09E3D8